MIERSRPCCVSQTLGREFEQAQITTDTHVQTHVTRFWFWPSCARLKKDASWRTRTNSWSVFQEFNVQMIMVHPNRVCGQEATHTHIQWRACPHTYSTHTDTQHSLTLWLEAFGLHQVNQWNRETWRLDVLLFPDFSVACSSNSWANTDHKDVCVPVC